MEWLQQLISAFLTFFEGRVIPLLLVVIALDMATGVIKAVVFKKLNSSVSWVGIGKKALTIVVVLLVKFLEPMLGGIDVANLVATFYIFSESVSILENAAELGVPIPSFLRDILAKLNTDNEKKFSQVTGGQNISETSKALENTLLQVLKNIQDNKNVENSFGVESSVLGDSYEDMTLAIKQVDVEILGNKDEKVIKN